MSDPKPQAAPRTQRSDLLIPVAALLFAAGAAASMAYLVTEHRLAQRIAVGDDRIITAERLMSALKDVETGERGYVITGDNSYLAPYSAGLTAVPAALARLATLGQAQDGLPALVNEKIQIAGQLVALRRQGGAADARSATADGRGKAVMDAVRASAAGIETAEADAMARARRVQAALATFLIGLATIAMVGCFAAIAWVARARQRSERASRHELALSEERFRTLIEASATITWLMPPQGGFDKPQPAWTNFTSLPFETIKGAGWLQSVHPDDRAQTAEVWPQAMHAGAPFTMEHRLLRRDGAWRNMLLRGVPVYEEDGSVREWVGTHSDITDRRQAEADLLTAKEAAEDANRAKSQFLANMSHELRTPLSAVIGYSEMLEEEIEDLGATSLLADVGKIRNNARHLLSLINDVLDLSKIEAERMTTYAEDFQTATLLRDVASTVDALVTKKNNTLVVDMGDDAALGAMHSDQVKLRQCLLNLISNAAKFTENGNITLRARREGADIVFSVADSGIGMSPEQLDKLFERFAQADASTTRRFGGTGLGLAITRAFCRLLGGDVTVTSEEGRGSTFTMRIPAILPEPEPEVETTQTAELTAAQSNMLVLVVDDDASQRELVARFLERKGFTVQLAADGKTGLALAKQLRPRAIMLDVMMPQMDGWSVLAALKADPDVAGIPVVLVTFVNEPALGESLGAAELVPKPVDWNHLSRVMERFRGEGDVMVVDDDADTRARLRHMLERNGWTVVEAANGQEALERVQQAAPQLILLDLTMPVMDGFTFLQALRNDPAHREIPVVVLTARDLSPIDWERLQGADRVLSKGAKSLRDLAGEVLALAGRHGDKAKE